MRLLATDPGTTEDVETFCRETGHRLEGSARDADGTLVFEISRKPLG